MLPQSNPKIAEPFRNESSQGTADETDSVGVGEPIVGTFAGRDGYKLFAGGLNSGLRLGAWISNKRVPRDIGHLVAKPFELTEIIEHAVVPPVCTENLIRVDDVMESPKLAE